MNAADTAFILVCSALVMFMTPGLALFYAGMARSKNVLGTVMQSFIMLGVASLVWAVVGYSLAFGPDAGGMFGTLEFAFLNGVGMDAAGSPADNLPHLLFMAFQCMFAVITPALITGAFAERMKFSAFLVFSVLWLVFVYCPMAHWVWGGGWMGEMGALDFAGGAVVHMSSGAGILWFGWFGFNAGSALAADGLAANALVTTHLAAAALAWIAVEWIHNGKPTTLGAASGAVAGLVVITPAAGFVTAMPAIVMGLVGGAVCYFGVLLKHVFKYDDSLDVVGIHGLGGTVGALLTGVFATVGAEGLIAGNPAQLWIQFVSVVGTWVFCFVMSLILFKLVDAVIGLRVGREDEIRGLDVSQHNEAGYQW